MAKLSVSPRYRFGRARVRDAVKAMLREAPAVLKLFGRLMTDARVSMVDRGLVAGVLAYVIAPVDLVPDFLGLIGVVDDLFLVGLALERLLARAPTRAVHEHWHGSRDGLLGLTAELQALGDALPASIRRILLGRMAGDEFGREAMETLFQQEDDDDYLDAQGHMSEAERITSYRNRL